MSEEGNPACLSRCSRALMPLVELCVKSAGLCVRCTGWQCQSGGPPLRARSVGGWGLNLEGAASRPHRCPGGEGPGRAAREGVARPRADGDPLPGGWGGGVAWGLERALPPGRRQCAPCVLASCEGPPPEHVGVGAEGGARKGRWPASGGARGAPAPGNSKAPKGRRGRAWWGGGLQVGSGPLAALEWSPCALASGFFPRRTGEPTGGGFFARVRRGCPRALGTPPTYTQVAGGFSRPGWGLCPFAFSSACSQAFKGWDCPLALRFSCLCCSEATSELW